MLIIVVLSSCNKATEPNSEVISDPQSRWQAYGLKNYSIDQQLNCFCVNGGRWVKVVVKDNQVVNVVDVSNDSSLVMNQWAQYKSVDQLFTIIRSINKDSVALFRVEYDSTYGYPKSFYVDPSSHIADEEYGYNSNNLVRAN